MTSRPSEQLVNFQKIICLIKWFFFYNFYVIIIVYRKYVILYVVYDSVNNFFLLNERLVFTNQLHLISIYNKETILSHIYDKNA